VSSHPAGPEPGAFVSAFFISLKAFSSPFPILKAPVLPLCGFIEWFGHEGVIRDPDLVETCGSPKLLICQWVLGAGMEHTACFLSGLRLHFLWDR
jgi:hypothetical protein